MKQAVEQKRLLRFHFNQSFRKLIKHLHYNLRYPFILKITSIQYANNYFIKNESFIALLCSTTIS